MIFDKLHNGSKYFSLHPLFEQAFNWLSTTDLKNLADGKYALSGEKLFAIVQSYETKQAQFEQQEAHKKYIDIQYMLSGEELIGISLLKDQKPTKQYAADDDYWLTDAPPSAFMQLSEGEFMIFYPTDLHMPCIQTEEKQSVRKIVIKVEV